MEHIRSFVEAKASRGLKNKRVALPIYGKRLVTCTDCPELVRDEENAWCGACKCPKKVGDTHMMPRYDKDYTKLHHPRLHCPLRNAGFSNYFDRVFVWGTRKDQNAFIKSLKHTDLMPVARRGSTSIARTLHVASVACRAADLKRTLVVGAHLRQHDEFLQRALNLPNTPWDIMGCSEGWEAFALQAELHMGWGLLSERADFGRELMEEAAASLKLTTHTEELFVA